MNDLMVDTTRQANKALDTLGNHSPCDSPDLNVSLIESQSRATDVSQLFQNKLAAKIHVKNLNADTETELPTGIVYSARKEFPKRLHKKSESISGVTRDGQLPSGRSDIILLPSQPHLSRSQSTLLSPYRLLSPYPTKQSDHVTYKSTSKTSSPTNASKKNDEFHFARHYSKRLINSKGKVEGYVPQKKNTETYFNATYITAAGSNQLAKIIASQKYLMMPYAETQENKIDYNALQRKIKAPPGQFRILAFQKNQEKDKWEKMYASRSGVKFNGFDSSHFYISNDGKIINKRNF